MLKFTFIKKILIISSLVLPTAVSTIYAVASTANNVNGSPTASTTPLDGNLQAAAIASKTWLGIVDSGKYDESWDDAAALMKLTVRKDEWNRIMNKTRKPLGSLKSRDVVDERTAFNPRGMPAGNYMVMVYKSTFANKASAYELVTLSQDNGQWYVLTYQID